MIGFYDIKIVRSRELSENIVESFDIDIISLDNAILYDIDKYGTVTNSSKISCGLVLHRGAYYFFEKCLTDKISVYNMSAYSYYVYCISSDMAKSMIESKLYNLWLIKFASMYYYGGFYKILNIYKETRYFYDIVIEDDKMFIPYIFSPYGMKDGITIRDYFCGWYKEYKDSVLEINNSLLRNIKLKHLDVNGSRL